MLKFETTKLFYDQYVYKLVIRNQLAHLFREKNYTWAKYKLDELNEQFEQGSEHLYFVRGQRWEQVETEDFLVARKLFHEFTNFENMKLRVQNPRMQIYSNDIKWLKQLSKKVQSACTEFWEPSKNNAPLLEANTILSHTIKDYEYRITLGAKTCPNFVNWIDSNPDKVKIGKTTYEVIRDNQYGKGLYFYVRDEKVLSLINLIIGGNIQRVDKIVYSAKTDK